MAERRKKPIAKELRDKITKLIREHYAKALAEELELIDKPGGLDILLEKYCIDKK